MSVTHAIRFSKHDNLLDVKLEEVCHAYFNDKNKYSLIKFDSEQEVKFRPPPEFMRAYVAQRKVHDEDYFIFKVFNEPESVILDIGANWGYSVCSLWAVGVKSRIISFEANGMNMRCLQAIRDDFPDVYQYYIQALSDQIGSLTFVAPIFNSEIMSALCTAQDSPNIKSLAKNIADYVRQYLPKEDDWFDFGLHEFSTEVCSLDSFLSKTDTFVNKYDVCAIKIDVEGLEFQVLRGAQELLMKFKPLILAEGGNRHSGLREYMDALGYLFAERDGEKLVLTSELGKNSNGFFIHKDKLSNYLKLGII